MRRTAIVVGIIFVLLVVTQVRASAQAGVISGCVNNRTGALRIVSDPGQCGPKEVAISWNQAGPEGPRGPQGEPGPPGPPGAGAVQVYDGTGAYVGMLAGINPAVSPDEPAVTIFIPSMGKFLQLRWRELNTSLETSFGWVYYTGPGCTGEPFQGPLSVNYEVAESFLFRGDAWYTVTLSSKQFLSSMSRRHDNGVCESPYVVNGSYFPLTKVEVSFPWPLVPPLQCQ